MVFEKREQIVAQTTRRIIRLCRNAHEYKSMYNVYDIAERICDQCLVLA